MTRPTWVQQVYGYAVCLVAIITFLITASNTVDAVFLNMNPLQASEGRYGTDEQLTSFEGFRARAMEPRGTRVAPDGKQAPMDTMSTAELRRSFEALRADRRDKLSFEAKQRMVKHGLLLLLSAVLFGWHWRWLRQRGEASA